MIHEYIIKVDDTKTDIMGGTPLEEPPKELVRCKDCVYWKPPHIRLNDGKQRAYKESDRESDPFGMLSVSMDVGINVGGKCWVDHNTGYSEDKRVFRSKNDFCGKARKLPDGETNESWWGLSEEPSELIDD